MPALAFEGAPEYLAAIFEALHFRNSSVERLRRLQATDWSPLLEWCDARQLTFMLPWLCGPVLPDEVHRRIEGCRNRYRQRFSELKAQLFEISGALDREGIESVVLKGFTHSPALTPDPLLRAQGDIDLWIPGDDVYRARDVLLRMGYVSGQRERSRHLSPMRRPSVWKWRGDRYDPEMPVAVELHFELWSERMERITVPEQVGFWNRKKFRSFDKQVIGVLCDEDLLGFAALHLLLHVLHGEFPAQRAWEIANFLHTRAVDETFWNSWRQAHPPAVRRLEVLVFQLVTKWFGCDLSRIIIEESGALPGRVRSWLDEYSFSPLTRSFRPNKDELWLHLALTSGIDRLRLLARRLLPVRLPNNGLVLSRAGHHLGTFLPTVVQGARWFLLRTR